MEAFESDFLEQMDSMIRFTDDHAFSLESARSKPTIMSQFRQFFKMLNNPNCMEHCIYHYTSMPCQCGYPDGMSPRGRMVFLRAEPE